MNPLDQLDPRICLEQLIADCTCDWCGKTCPAEWNVERTAYAPVVIQEWRARVQKKTGYTVKTYAYWRICVGCRLGDAYAFSKWVFPIIKNVGLHDLMSQLVQVQPMALPTAQVFYADYVAARPGVARRVVGAIDPVVPRPAHDDMADAFLGALGVAANQLEAENRPIKPGSWKAFAQMLPRRGAVRGQREHVVMLDDANWRLDANPGEPD